MDPEVQPEVIDICSTADMDIIVNQYTDDDQKRLTKSVLFKVQRGNLVDNSEYFRAMLRRGRWLESDTQKITLEEDNCTGMEVLLRSLHGTLEHMSLDSVTIAGTWHVIMSCDKYNVDQKRLSAWFKNWWKHESQKPVNKIRYARFAREVMYPCFVFDYAPGFQEVTKRLVYESIGHITENNPTDIRQMHLPPRVIQQVNAARGRLRTILHRELYDKLGQIVKTGKCSCKELTTFEYLRELGRIQVWPLEDSMRNQSVQDMLGKLSLFTANNMRSYTNPKTGKVETRDLRSGGDRDDDYWMHNEMQQWDAGCRVKHGQVDVTREMDVTPTDMVHQVCSTLCVSTSWFFVRDENMLLDSDN
ncbi:hypothetical protein ASPBRDRAFT_665892 [Aspergillus brasiliensis CBS 101740]|uniref:BTB domain-containing protein n=1 Tax=Aspergillus brasiliensis (strain CBS 101740 / IMI 381727 / IBT 21946) TaxID=767769 RepID=A0A1L9U3W4_ASPBC|nr:hypothetical protein ASPBRDRAFT_665892 [Aspergillus brasiliensis CBS 101740]